MTSEHILYAHTPAHFLTATRYAGRSKRSNPAHKHPNYYTVNHFFALYSVVGSLALGLSPIFWGLVIDGIGQNQRVWMGVEWNRFSLFFAAVVLVFLVTLILARRLEEPKAATLEQLIREVLIESPQRALLRLWPKD